MSSLSLVQVRTNVILAIAQSNAMKKAGKIDEGWAILVDTLRTMADALEDPENAAIMGLVGMIAESESERVGEEVSEADVYLRLMSYAGITPIEEPEREE